jgi:hypothetical protein
LPVAEDAAVAAEIALIVDAFVSTKWDVELAARIEAAQAVVTGAVQVVEERRRFGGRGFAIGNELVETAPVLVKESLAVGEFELAIHFETALQPRIEMYRVRVDVVQKRALGTQAQGDGQTTAEGLD